MGIPPVENLTDKCHYEAKRGRDSLFWVLDLHCCQPITCGGWQQTHRSESEATLIFHAITSHSKFKPVRNI